MSLCVLTVMMANALSKKPPARGSGWLAAVPAASILFVCAVLPLGWMALTLLTHPAVRSELSITAFRAGLLGRTLGYNAAAALIATLMGLPAAIVLGRGRGLLARVLWVILPSTLLMPSLAYVYGWSQVVRLARPMLEPLGITFSPSGNADVFRCIWSLGTWLWAVPAVLIGLTLRRMDTAVQEHALLDGAMWRVTLRQLGGSIIASLAVVTLLATQEFAVYEPTGISVVATEVRMVFDTGAVSSTANSIAASGLTGGGIGATDQPQRAAAAVATGVPLLGITAMLAILAVWAAGHSEAADAPATGRWPRALDAPRGAVWATVFLVVLNLGVPVAALAASLKVTFSPVRMIAVFGPQLGGSAIIAAVAAVMGLVAAMSCAARWPRGALVISGAAFLVGGQLLAIALIRLFNRPGLFWAYNSAVVPVIAYLGRFGWLAVAAGRGVWSRRWNELRELATVDGASPVRAAASIIWPLAWPTLLAGGLLVGALSLTEVPATVLLNPLNPQVLTPTLMGYVHMVRYDPMIDASLLMIASALLPALAAVLLIRPKHLI